MGALLTKVDSDARGGVAFAFRYALKKPILFVATGEKLEDLEPFRPERMASRIMGMGDLNTLLEHAQKKIKQHDQDRLSRSMQTGSFTLNDFAVTMSMMNSLGSLSALSKYLPSNLGLTMTSQQAEHVDKEMKKFKAIMSSMTPKERMIPSLLDGSRKKRIAQGAGVTPADVNLLLARFEQIKQYAKLMKKMGKSF
jgi:signal recognition particle subunit SRP54